jgi:hypothetical protein
MTEVHRPYVADKPAQRETNEQLRARIPGWGVDLDPQDRPGYPREQPGIETGAHWELPERQEETYPRERSIEHGMLPPVFGTVAPLHGVSGAIKRYAYARYGEARLAHWLLLIVGDRVEAFGAHLRSYATLQPDLPLPVNAVVAGEVHGHGIRSRFGQRRSDVKHQWVDPIVILTPWVVTGWAGYRLAKAVLRRG